MKIEKMSFEGIKNVLSRAEMKKIMAGSGGCNSGYAQCYSNVACCPGATCLPGPLPGGAGSCSF
jgi:hypothetical protein